MRTEDQTFAIFCKNICVTIDATDSDVGQGILNLLTIDLKIFLTIKSNIKLIRDPN